MSATQIQTEVATMKNVEEVRIVNGGKVMPASKKSHDGVYTINDLLMERTRTIPHTPLVGYPATSRGTHDYVYYTAKDLDRFADEAMRTLMEQGLPLCVSLVALKNR